jgi:hypothetical protein
MKMKVLRRATTIEGPDCFGRTAWLRFEPTIRPGWWWQPSGSESVLPIDLNVAAYNPRVFCIQLDRNGSTLHIWEHIGVCRLLGLADGVIVSGTDYPPYHGRPWEVWEALRPHLAQTGKEARWVRPERGEEWRYAKGREGFVRIEPHPNPATKLLVFRLCVDYRGLGRRELVYTFCDEKDHREMLQTGSQGWPRWRYYLCRGLSCLSWPHIDAITWPQKFLPDECLRRFILHRVGDLAGAMSLAHQTALPSAIVTSHCAGHKADLALLAKTRWVPV